MKSIAEPARRLSYDDGHWILETTELMRLDRDLYRPEKRRIAGTDAILAHLRSKGEGALLSSAERLIRVSDLDGSTYEAHDGEWVVAEPSIPPGRPSRSEELSHNVDELRAEVVFLRAAYAGLTSRLRKLEKFMTEIEGGRVRVQPAAIPEAPQIHERPEPANVPEKRAPAAQAAPAIPAVASPGQELRRDLTLKSGGTPDAVVGGALLSASSPPARQVEPEPQPEAPPVAAGPSLPPVTLPGVPAVLSTLRQLVGDGLTLDPIKEKLPTAPEALEKLDVSLFIDDEGAERVVVFANTRATVELGGQLLGVPKAAQEEQIKSGEVEQDLVLAMSEIFNNLSGVVNREEGNPHLKAEAIAKTPIDRLPWLGAPSSVLTLATPSGGRLWLVAR